MREVNGDSLAAEKPVAKVFVVGAVILHACGFADVVSM